MNPANDNRQPFQVAFAAETRSALQQAIVSVLRELEPEAPPTNWIVRYGERNAEGLATATLRRRVGAPK